MKAVATSRTRGSIVARLAVAAATVVSIVGGSEPMPFAQAPGPVDAIRKEGRSIATDAVTTLAADEAARQAESARGQVAVDLAEGLDLRLWAADPLLHDPIALDIDGHGRVFVSETSRRRSPDVDIRLYRDWVLPMLAFRTVDDRRRFFREALAPERSQLNAAFDDANKDGSHDWRDLLVNKERVSRIEDTDGDGFADRSIPLIEDFHTEVTDVAGGVLAHGDDVYVAVSPDVWRLRDVNGDGVPDTKQAIASGFHVHIGFGGHGMSGLRLGPDGRIYWSIGDVGMNTVDSRGQRHTYLGQGAIVRANPDGSDFEVFAAGLRNAHEFAFDEHGNLLSVDNDGDHAGETERVVYVTNGQDSGWRITWQLGKYTDPDNNSYKAWMDEGMFKPRFDGQAAWFTPGIAAYNGGPAGLVYNPGTALSDRWKRHIFVADFSGAAASSRINAFAMTESGAGFTAAEPTPVLTGIVATGMQFGPDGALYIADWIAGWGTKNQGRIWRLDDLSARSDTRRAETRSLLAADVGARSAADLRALLSHDDMRVRLKAQFELASRSDASTLTAVTREDTGLAALHAVWGLAQMARVDRRHAAAIVPLLGAAAPELRAQAAKMLGDIRYAEAAGQLVVLLEDPEARPRFFAAEALGRIGYRPAVEPIVAMLEANDDRDVYLRHAGALALARIGDSAPLAALSTHPSRALRIAAVVALRRLKSPDVARFLADTDEFVVTEAARAINDDGGIAAALPALARILADGRVSGEPFTRRAISANLRVGTEEAAERLGAFARRTGSDDAMRVEALAALGVWPKPSVLDRVDGAYLGRVERDASAARRVVEALVQPLLADSSPAVKVALFDAVGRLTIEAARPSLAASVRGDASARVRIAALRALAVVGVAGAEDAVAAALSDGDASVRMTALELLPSLGLADQAVVELLATVLERGATPERQRAVTTLGRLAKPESDRVLESLVDRLTLDNELGGIELELLETARARGTAPLLAALDRADGRRPSGVLGRYRELLEGGDAAVGRRLVASPSAQCSQCHSVEVAGATVGPVLRGVGARLSREDLLVSLLDPGARVAPGFGTVGLTLHSGTTVTGRLMEETSDTLVLDMGEGRTTRVTRAEIARRDDGPSPMPPSSLFLNPRELRDVVEYLTTLR